MSHINSKAIVLTFRFICDDTGIIIIIKNRHRHTVGYSRNSSNVPSPAKKVVTYYEYNNILHNLTIIVSYLHVGI